MQQAQHARLSFADGKGKRLEHRALQRNPVSRRVHFVFGQFQLAVTDGFVRKELDFLDRKSTRLNSSHVAISYAVFCLKKKKKNKKTHKYKTIHNINTINHS